MATASDLANLGSTISEANAAAAVPTTGLVAAAQDEVSTAIAALFGSHARQFQALSAKAAAFHNQFVQALTGGAASYAEAEAANVLRLTVGDHAAASGAAALSKAAAATPAAFGLEKILKLWGELFKIAPKMQKFVDPIEVKLEADFKAAEKASRELRAQRLVANGLRLIGKDGALLFTDGKELLALGGRNPFLYSPEFIYARQYLTDAWGIQQQTLRSLLGSEIHVIARGEGLVQSYFQRVGNEIYRIDTNAQGQITQKFKTTEAIFKKWVTMTRGKVFQRF
jgi:hypothetical protein